MLIDTPQARLQLRPGQMAHLELAPRSRLRGVSGQAWITLDNDCRDIVLGPGEEFIAEVAGHAMASALRGADPAELLVVA
jgi:hypothetical protein